MIAAATGSTGHMDSPRDTRSQEILDRVAAAGVGVPPRRAVCAVLETLGEVSYNRFLLKFTAEGHEFTVFPDGRAIIKGTSDVEKARTLYAKYIGH